ncbi:hypothetical protein HDU86_004098 [Geranomyces michiganensis]|nr:hypothetical protein HDU86_004098 [Geranomyces michiganensis]
MSGVLSLPRLPPGVLSVIAGFLADDLPTFLAFTSSSSAFRAAVRPGHYAALVAHLYTDAQDEWYEEDVPLLFSFLHAPVPPRGFLLDGEEPQVYDRGPPFFPFLRPDEELSTMIADDQQQQQQQPPQLSSAEPQAAASPFFLAILERLKKLDLLHHAWIPRTFGAERALLQAMRWDLLPLAKSMHSNGAVCKSADPLLFAARSGNIEIVRWAVHEKLFVQYEQPERIGIAVYGPLDEAYQANRPEILSYLAEAARGEPGMAYMFTNTWPPTFEKAVERNDVDFLDKMLAGGNSGTAAATCAGQALNDRVTRLLHEHRVDLSHAFGAACGGRAGSALKIIEYLDLILSWDNGDGNKDDIKLNLGLHFAFWARNLELVQYLLSLGAQLSAVGRMAGFALLLKTSTSDEEFFFAVIKAAAIARGHTTQASWNLDEAVVPMWAVTDENDPEAGRKAELVAKLKEALLI